MTTLILDRGAETAADDTLYYQCDLRQGVVCTTGWIEARGAKVGARIEIKHTEGLWDVVAVYRPPQAIAWLREKQRKDRGSLKSIKGQ